MKRSSFASQLILFGLLLKGVAGYAQAPSLSYPSGTHAYPLNSAISPLAVTNTGGTPAANGTVSTFAGGSYGTTDGTGTAASFEQPLGAITDNQGNIYIADGQAHNIRKITPAGVVTTLAGSAGYSGFTNGTGTSATFWHPVGLAADASGNIYVADEDNNAIRMITPGGVVTTLAGTGSAGSSDGSAGSATFYYPCGVAVDGSGNVYVADYNNNKIRKISNGVVSTFAGSGSAGSTDGTGTGATFNHPFSVGVDAAGNVYVTDRSGQKIRKITPGGVVTTLAGSGTAGYADGTGSSAMFNSPTNLTVDQSGNVYVTDETNQRIRMVSPSGVVTTVAGTGSVGSTNGAASSATFNNPFAIAVNAFDNVYVGDAGSGLIRQIVFSAFSVSPSLPAGLVLNNMTGTISGTPTAATVATGYTVTAANSYGTGTATVIIATGGGIASPSQDQNYIVTYTPRAPITDITQFGGASVGNVNQTIAYFDGLGRPLQAVQWAASQAGNDVVQPIAYDSYGREVKKYLPYALTSSQASDGSYKPTAIADENSFYLTPPSNSNVSSDSYPYSQIVYEPSPLNRPTEQGAPGNDWQPSGTAGTDQNAGHTVKISYDSNGQNDNVKQWLWNSNGNGAYWNNTYYGQGKLYKTTTTDENGHHVIEYKDNTGHVVCKNAEGRETYYIYDDYQNLAYVVPPIPVSSTLAYPTSFTESSADPVFNAYIYGYHYDSRERLVEKKVPGKDWQYLVYNHIDQVVFTQNGNQRNQSPQQWSFTKYDGQGRVIITGIYQDPNYSSAGTNYRSALQGSTDPWQTNFLWESRDNANSGGAGTGYSNQAPPTANIVTYLTVNYYDDYNFYGFPGYSSTANGVTSEVSGLKTASEARILNSDGSYGNMLWQVDYYDQDGAMVESVNQNYIGGADRVVNTLNFNKQVAQSIRTHSSSWVASLAITSQYDYDNQGRLTNTRKQIGNNSMITLSQQVYNEVGQLYQKNLHSANGTSGWLQTVTNSYNERGWLTHMNSSYFDLQLRYNKPILGGQQNWNGNIAEQDYTASVMGHRWTTYHYDELNRLTDGNSSKGLSETSIQYDDLGNINWLTRGTNAPYQYSYSGNQLQSVSGLTSGNYQYDQNGNMTSDARNGTSVDYNILDLPRNMSGKNLTYVYDATGRKLAMTLNGTTRYYDDGIEYTSITNDIDFIHTEEGRALNSAGSYNYEYTLSDHLGNNRVTFDVTHGEVGEEDYYPFGMSVPVQPTNNHYLYNKKELQDATGDYDYGARFYDPVIAKWTSVDPLAEASKNLAIYNYGNNNPIKNIDPDGKEVLSGQGQFGGDLYTGFDALNLYKELQQQQNHDEDKKDNSKKHTDIYVHNKDGSIARYPDGALKLRPDVRDHLQKQLNKIAIIEQIVGFATMLESGYRTLFPKAPVVDENEEQAPGAVRAQRFSSGWANASLEDAINKFAPDAEAVQNGQKILYTNEKTGVQVVYDEAGNYFRIQDTKLTGRRQYLDMEGNIPNNKVVNGRQTGRSQAEYNQATHFNNLDN